MKVTQEAQRQEKEALSATIKQQQELSRREKLASTVPLPSAGVQATRTLQQMYTGDASSAMPTTRGGNITVRLVAPDGQDNVRISAQATFGDLRCKIEAELGIPGEQQTLATDRGCNHVVRDDSATLASMGIQNGSFVGLKYAGFERTAKVSGPPPWPCVLHGLCQPERSVCAVRSGSKALSQSRRSM